MPHASGFIPSRHPVQPPAGSEMLGIIEKLMPSVRPSPERWRQMGEALMQGDPLMDDVVGWMLRSDRVRAKAKFDQALNYGLASCSRPPAALRALFEQLESTPRWLDRKSLTKGARIHYRSGADGIFLARDVAFIGGYQASGFNRTLLMTGALKKGAARRFAETLQWALDCTGTGGMDRFGAGFLSTVRVRLIHAMVRHHLVQRPDWDAAQWGLPINQTDMAATLLGALVVPMICAQLFGMPLLRHERDAVVHHARYVGWLMGVEEHWLARDSAEAMVLLYQLLLSINNPDETSALLAGPMADDPLYAGHGILVEWRERFERSRHLSISRAFLGANAMHKLGLPARILPWYPAMAIPRNLARSMGARVTPGGLARLERNGRREQEALLARITQQGPAVVGQSAQGFAA